MIANPNSLTMLQIESTGATQMRERIRHLVVSKFALNALTSPAFGHILYNLPFMLTFDVLKQALLQAREKGKFTGTGYKLGELMESAKSSLPWIDWECLRDAVKRQNEFAHDGKLYGDVQCLADIADIEAQLTAWGIVPAV